MCPSAELFYDVTSALSQGRRDQQEDAVVADFPVGAGIGFAVLADGMGGHAAGDVASKIVVTEVFSELKMQSGDADALARGISGILRDAVLGANECVRFHADANPETEGMGATLVAPVLLNDRLFWISVGDSPLYLFRDGALTRLNEDHSMVPQIDYMVSHGMMDSDTGNNHPDRNCLTSVLIGQDIPQIDCPADPVQLMAGDIVLVASDGLQFLPETRIAALVAANAGRPSAAICAELMRELDELDDPDQDNISLCVIRVTDDLHPKVAPDLSEPPEVAARPEPSGLRKRSGVAFMASASNSKKIVTYRVSMEKSA